MAKDTFSGNGNYYLDVDAAVQSQNIAGNYSTIYWRVYVVKTGGYGHWASVGTGNSGYADSNVGGNPDLWNNGNLSYDFRNGENTGSFLMAQGTFNVTHRSDGTAEYFVNAGMTLAMLGNASAGTGTRALPSLKRKPEAPTSLGVSLITTSSMRYRFDGNGNGGSPILEWQVGYGTDPSYVQAYISSSGTSDFTGLPPNTTFYFWSRGRNAVGWGPWSARSSGKTLTGGARIRVKGVWKNAVPYVRVKGVWKQAVPYVRVKGVWKQTN